MSEAEQLIHEAELNGLRKVLKSANSLAVVAGIASAAHALGQSHHREAIIREEYEKKMKDARTERKPA